MKKNILFTALSIISTFSITEAQNVIIPDANFKAYLVGNLAINTNSDTEIQLTEANAFNGGIVCASSGISSLTGIESFTALTQLVCNNNLLTSVTLTANIALTDLRLQTNLLTNIDVSANTAINYLFCNGNNLGTLNLSSNTALIALYCNSCQLTSLNLSANTALNEVYCFANQLTSLDLSNNTVLTTLVCSSNQLSSLNIKNGNNSNMPGTSFEAWTNPNLTCIQVDNVAYSTTNWAAVDATASFNLTCGTTGINTLYLNNAIRIYPNPNNGDFTIQSQMTDVICVTNELGQVIETLELNQHNNFSYKVNHLQSGIYFLVGKTVKQKVIVSK